MLRVIARTTVGKCTMEIGSRRLSASRMHCKRHSHGSEAIVGNGLLSESATRGGNSVHDGANRFGGSRSRS